LVFVFPAALHDNQLNVRPSGIYPIGAYKLWM